MRVTVIGCGDAFGSGGRFQSATLVEHLGETCLVDCGATTTTALAAHGIDPDRIETLILTHLHGDHFGGIPFLLLDAQWSRQRTRPLVIVGPPGTRERLNQAIEVFFPGSIETTPWSFDWHVVEVKPCGKTVTKFGEIGLRTTEVVHPAGAPSTAIRLEIGDRVFAHSGDTYWTDSLYDVLAGADIGFIECHSFDKPLPMHIDYSTLVEKRAGITARKLILTHLGPDMLLHQHHVDRDLFDIASDGRVFAA